MNITSPPKRHLNVPGVSLRDRCVPVPGYGLQQGLSLVELMVAILISSLILIGLVQVFSGSRQTYSVNEGMSRLQENGRFAVDFLERDIRMAGNVGCRNMLEESATTGTAGTVVATNYLNNQTIAPFDLTWGAIQGFDANGTAPGNSLSLPSMYPPTLSASTTPSMNPDLVASAAQGSDVLVLRMMDGDNVAPLVPDPSSSATPPSYETADNLFISSQANIKPNQVVVVSDCEKMSVFQVTGVASSGGVLTLAHASGTPSGLPGDPGGNSCGSWGLAGCPGDPVNNPYKKGAQLSSMQTVAYFIGPGANGGPSLFRNTWNNSGLSSLELVEGVENMQVLFGISSPNVNPRNAAQYVTASQMPTTAVGGAVQPDWSKVVSVRVALLVSGNVSANINGQTNAGQDTATYDVNGVDVSHVTDMRQRRVFTTTMDLRNQH